MVRGELPPGHGLNPGAVYGPVCSRRYGRTLGINPMPGSAKVCSFNCVYCQLGWTPANQPTEGVFTDPLRIGDEMERALGASEQAIDGIVICGNGEPTLHPHFDELVDRVLSVRARLRPLVPVVCLTNGSELFRPEVRSALGRLDECSLKLDAGTPEGWKRVDRPLRPSFRFEELVEAMASLPRKTVQSCFLAGGLANDGEREVEAWVARLARIGPERVDLYTVSRRTASDLVEPLPVERLEAIAARARQTLTCEVRVAS